MLSGSMITPVTVYSDFNCPFCYALNERLNALGVSEKLAWRGVQHAPHLPVPMEQRLGARAEEMHQEVEAVCRLAPDLSIAPPTGKPSTSRAIRAAALVFGIDQERGRAFKDLLYRALWCEGLDISNPSILDRLAWTAGLGTMSFAALDSRLVEATTSRWQEDWAQTGAGAVPVMIRQDGVRLIGLADRDRILTFLHPPQGIGKPN